MSAEFSPPAPLPEAPFGPPTPLPEAPKTSPTEYLVSAEVAPDGTVDTSRALAWHRTPEDAQRIQESVQRSQEREQQEREQSLAIPDNAQVGTAHYTWYELRNMGIIAQERLRRDPDDIAAQRAVRRSYIERALLDNLSQYEKRLRQQAPGSDALTSEQSQRHSLDLPAVTMSEMLADQVDHWESSVAQNTHAGRPAALRDRWLDTRSDQEVLDAAHDLERRLTDQASRSTPQTH